jgi:purine-binding chemotaxis protein CheW
MSANAQLSEKTGGRTSGPGAAAAAAASKSGEQTQYLTFMLERETFAIGILAIREIIEYNKLTVVPMMPVCIRGVINLRGAVVPVMDLAARFGRAPARVSKRTCIVIVEIDAGDQRQEVGVMVDAVNEVLDIAAADIEPPPSFGARIRAEFIQGIGKVNGQFVMLLDVNHVFSSADLAALGALEIDAQASAAPEPSV